jgi:hypothetical protein
MIKDILILAIALLYLSLIATGVICMKNLMGV